MCPRLIKCDMAKKSQDWQDDEAYVSFSKKNIAILFGGIAAIAVLSFLLGYLTQKVEIKPERAEIKEPLAEEPPLSRIKPTPLDVDEITREAKTQTAPPAPEKFTFPDTLTDDKPSAPVPLKPKAETSAKEPEKPEAKKTAAALKSPEKETSVKETPRKAQAVKPEPPAKKPTTKVAKAAVPKQSEPTPKTGTPSRTPPPAPAGKSLTIQVGSFTSENDANRLLKRLVTKDFNAYIQPVKVEGQRWYRVRVGVYKTERVARREAARLEKSEKLPTLIMAYER